MPTNLKRMVRARMAETGESYQAALRHVRAQEGAPAHRCDWDGCTAAVTRDGDWCPAHACNCNPADQTGGGHHPTCPQFDPAAGAEPVQW